MTMDYQKLIDAAAAESGDSVVLVVMRRGRSDGSMFKTADIDFAQAAAILMCGATEASQQAIRHWNFAPTTGTRQ